MQSKELENIQAQLAEISAIAKNLVHEVEILKEALFQQGVLSKSKWSQCFNFHKPMMLYNPKTSQLKAMESYKYTENKWKQLLEKSESTTPPTRDL